ncbi:MAG: type II toxin-antitoxin system RelE/ParE family toxin [Anaerolineales bacterium]|nr:type II toxin-antitoxin system RelE/ParE family toxin [Anaerolineales bacterium]
MAKFVLEFTNSAFEDLAFFKKYEQSLILDAISLQLVHQPHIETRNRKQLESNPLAEWELRVGSYRIFYDIAHAESSVKIKAIGYKEHNKLFIRGKEYTL